MEITPINKALVEAGFITAPIQSLKTREQFKNELIAQGKTVKDWAEKRGFTAQQVTGVLTGGNKCNRGIGHKIAIAMGIKADPDQSQE